MNKGWGITIAAAAAGLSITLGGYNLMEEKNNEPVKTLAAEFHSETRHAPKMKNDIIKDEILLDVPLFNQMDAPRLYNGCEVTSLAMLLNFEGYHVTKNELANKIDTVPLRYNDGRYGSPYAGFVGDMANGPGLGVYNGPIFKLAQSYAGEKAENLTGQSFDEIMKKVSAGSPVWIITTASLSPAASFEDWDTAEGTVKVTFNMHSVVITGYDEEHIYVNDPYGTKDRKADKDAFIKAWKMMGSQAVAVN
jgi:uncharacterized protein YvpB